MRSMSKAFRMYLLHLDAGTARRWACRPSRLYPAGPGVDATWRIDDEMRSDGLWKGRSGGIGYAARDMARQVKWEDPALRRERERERERERTRASGRRACEKEEREKERASESENERREDSREGAREAREGERTRVREREREREREHARERARTRKRGTEDARRVAGRAATTGRVDGETQEELKRPSDCWYVPVCRVWGDSKEDA